MNTKANTPTKVIEFECGHKVDVPILPPNEAQYWLDQSYSKLLQGGVGACSGCADKRHKHGAIQRVIGVSTRTEYYTPNTEE